MALVPDYKHDIAISYAGEDEQPARLLREALTRRGIAVFHAPARQAELVGEEIGPALRQNFSTEARFVVALLSKEYEAKGWARFELETALAEERSRTETFVLPVILRDEALEAVPNRKIAIDLASVGVEAAADTLAERVRVHRGEFLPHEAFERAYRDWVRAGFVPGVELGRLFLDGLEEIDLDVDRCEFLLHCPQRSHERLQEGLRKIQPDMLLAAAERLYAKAEKTENTSGRMSAIAHIGRVDRKRAERLLRDLYEDESLPVGDRANAFAELWKCESEAVTDESRELLLDRQAPPALRRAAAINLLWSPRDAQTEATLGRAILDPRQEVRKIVCYAIDRFDLAGLAPQLIEAYRRCRSRLGKYHVKETLRLFSQRPDVAEFGREAGFGPKFFEPPSSRNNWEADRQRDAWG